MLKFEIQGFDEVKRNLERLSQNAKALDGSHNVPLKDLLPSNFVRQHTAGKYGSLDEWFAGSPFKVENQADFAGVPQAGLDDYVQASTDFPSWQAMTQAGTKEYVKRRLFEK